MTFFYGELQSTPSLDGITLSHRIADSPPDEVETHVEAHFVLVTSGHYVSSAGPPNRRPTQLQQPSRLQLSMYGVCATTTLKRQQIRCGCAHGVLPNTALHPLGLLKLQNREAFTLESPKRP